jgi:hypothetical protein
MDPITEATEILEEIIEYHIPNNHLDYDMGTEAIKTIKLYLKDER